MRKYAVICLSLLLLFVFALTGCQNGTERGTAPEAPVPQTAEGSNAVRSDGDAQVSGDTEERASASAEQPSTGSKTLVIYFSRTGEQYTVGVIDKGNTAIVAEMIAEKTGADTFEIVPADDRYPMTYDELTDVAKREQKEKARPAYKGALPDLSGYDTVYIGAPVWWGDWPMIMYTVFENNDFTGKKLVPFSTHEGSGLSGFDKKLASACPGSEILTGHAFRGNDCQNARDSVRNAVDAWISKVG